MRRQSLASFVLTLCSLFTVNSFAGDPIVFSPDGKLVAVGKMDGSIELVEVETGKLRSSFSQLDESPHPASAIVWRPKLAFSPEGVVLASACGSSQVTLWNVDSGEEIMTLPSSSVGYDLKFSNNGIYLVGVGVDTKIGPHRLTLWNADTGEVVKEMTVEFDREGNWRNAINQIRFSDADEILAFETMEDGKKFVNVWNIKSAKETMRAEVDSWSMSADGQRIVTRTSSERSRMADSYRIWDSENGKLIRDLSNTKKEKRTKRRLIVCDCEGSLNTAPTFSGVD